VILAFLGLLVGHQEEKSSFKKKKVVSREVVFS